MKYIFANLKMQLDYNETLNLLKKLKNDKKIKELKNIQLVVCCDYISIPDASKIIKNSNLKLSSQNIFWEEFGAYTGEILTKNLKKFNTEFSMIGHSERRINLSESDEMINKKIQNALRNEIIPILCVGENLKQRKKNEQQQIIKKQIISALKSIDLKKVKKIFIAYEPIWAISSNNGINIDPKEADKMNNLIKEIIIKEKNIKEQIFNKKITLIYGGSVNDKNIKELITKKNINGVLVGSYSTKSKNIIKLIDIINKSI
ncbi:MAG: triose-phosphate isomerase [Patescibacteria group bacterium]|nr:triose-phosphate isomerase [Patescibacteria group bacterium]MDD4304371.1 triose-phosphate isomerase [Patescibacteria group bacterium]MDD4695394.1 triose-phosphate isomerase [Patescibacteria group bacterium]